MRGTASVITNVVIRLEPNEHFTKTGPLDGREVLVKQVTMSRIRSGVWECTGMGVNPKLKVQNPTSCRLDISDVPQAVLEEAIEALKRAQAYEDDL